MSHFPVGGGSGAIIFVRCIPHGDFISHSDRTAASVATVRSNQDRECRLCGDLHVKSRAGSCGLWG